MESLCNEIRDDFEYSIRTHSPQKEQFGCLLSEYDIMKIHYYLSDYFLSKGEIVRYGILSFNLLSSAVSRQCVSLGQYEKWKSPFDKLATLVFGLTKDHAFNDGNKRTAFLSLLLALRNLKRQICCKKSEFETLLVRIASNELFLYKSFHKYHKKSDPEVLFISDFIRHNTRKNDTTYHSLTFFEFNRKLRRFNVWMDNPQGNNINVYKKTNKEYLFGLYKKSQDNRILQIGFPGWKSQINPKAVKSVLSAANLTVEHGVDSKVFYEDEQPEYILIEEYYSILKRLKDK